jgi:FMN-dependent NADH-azoreductase
MQLLHIDASPRGARSHTRRLSREFISAWLRTRPFDQVDYLDVGLAPPPPVDEAWIAAAFTAPEGRTPAMRDALKVSDGLLRPFLTAELIVIGLPMYNFSVPAGFKAFIDQIARVGVTFAFDPEDEQNPYKPLLRGKRMIVIVATGDAGYEAGGRYERLNHLDPYLRTVFGFLGIVDITFIHVGNDEFGGKRLAESVTAARARIENVIAGSHLHDGSTTLGAGG